MAHPEIEHLLGLLDEAYNRAAWRGPNLRGSIRGLTARKAALSPRAGRHNIWEIVIHAAYWKYAVKRLLGEKRGSFSLPGSNWIVRPMDRSEKAWRADINLLDREHQRLKLNVIYELGLIQAKNKPTLLFKERDSVVDIQGLYSNPPAELRVLSPSIDLDTQLSNIKDLNYATSARFDLKGTLKLVWQEYSKKRRVIPGNVELEELPLCK